MMKNIILEKQERIGLVIIDHPPANTFNLAALEDFETALDELESDRDIRVVVITGAGEKCFSAGFDVSDEANIERTVPKGQELWRRVDRFSRPIIAAINGYALGGGCELAISCHFRIMVDQPKAQIGLTEVNLGVIPGWGGTQRLPRLVGRARALDMILFGKKINAPEALEVGLINQVATPDRLMDQAMDLAGRLAERPPLSVSCVLKAMSAGLYGGLDAGLQAELESAAILRQSEDVAEGFAAFLEKRAPVFKGR